MILKNEEHYQIPRECLICRGLSPDERKRISRDSELNDIARQRLYDLHRLLANDANELAKERERLAAARKLKRAEFDKLLRRSTRLHRVDVRAWLHEAATAGKLLDMLTKSESGEYHAVRDMLAHVTGGKGNMTDKEFLALPGAFQAVLKDHPTAMGMFRKASAFRAPGMSAMQQHYEILSTAALKLKDVVSLSGKNLRIYDTDRVDFGMKFARGFVQPSKGGTFEADTLIDRPRGPLEPDKTIGIDAKYTKRSHYTDIPWEQLKGIRNNIGHEFEEFYFVTNRQFSDPFKSAVQQTNRELVRDFLAEHNRTIDILPYLTKEEREARPDRRVETSELDKVLKEQGDWARIAEQYQIPQIEMCEHVRYPGT
jgi:hypothetical protein